MHDCCIRVTALLECFKWIWNKLHNRMGGETGRSINHAISGWGSTFSAIISVMAQNLRRMSPRTRSLLVSKGGMVIMLQVIFMFKTNK